MLPSGNATVVDFICNLWKSVNEVQLFPENEGTRVRGDFFFLLLSFKRTDFGMGGLFS